MTLTTELISALLNRYSNIGSKVDEKHASHRAETNECNISFYKESNWLSGITDYQTKLQLACLYEEIAKKMVFNKDYSRLFEYLIFPLAKGFTIKFKRCYSAKSFVQVLHKEFLLFGFDDHVKWTDLQEVSKTVLTDFMRKSDYLNYQMFEDFEHGQQIDKMCEYKQ
jgi:hypothetical protein